MLVQEVLEAAMIRANDEFPRPELRTPVADSVHQSNQLALICSELCMLRHHLLAEERNGARP
jgi:hypothetical protein